MKTKDDVAKEYETRIKLLKEKYKFDQAQLKRQYEHECKILEDRYSKILKAHTRKKPN